MLGKPARGAVYVSHFGGSLIVLGEVFGSRSSSADRSTAVVLTLAFSATATLLLLLHKVTPTQKLEQELERVRLRADLEQLGVSAERRSQRHLNKVIAAVVALCAASYTLAFLNANEWELKHRLFENPGLFLMFVPGLLIAAALFFSWRDDETNQLKRTLHAARLAAEIKKVEASMRQPPGR